MRYNTGTSSIYWQSVKWVRVLSSIPLGKFIIEQSNMMGKFKVVTNVKF